ncbi:40S ribosomal protein S22 [Rhizoctonia solani AG-3 Rhs1AP]|uniref:40S ribosomal protein S22 n=2 Tax=Rhizoctonia solani AG-3 TaxID=1086053 RepID=A0A074RLS3_9AGAM|nr:40S ribosomal protein S22 [Rhizoctonia solani AG-3 Rhs1AP]KEP46270.1 40S ribosomal protein S22 [Rhizoctonia solani 123E]
MPSAAESARCSSARAPRSSSSSSVMQRHGYMGEFEQIDDHRSGKIVVQLNGHLNKTGDISSRFNIQVNWIDSWVNLLLLARAFGVIILFTSAGILDHDEARRKHARGKLLGYVYQVR